MGMLTVEANKDHISEYGSFVEPFEVMIVGVTEDLKDNKDDRKKMECEESDEELFDETVVELVKVVFPKP